MAGNDTLKGQDGFDTADYSGSPAGINANLVTGTVRDGFGGTDTVSSIEGVVGTAFNDTILASSTTPENFSTITPGGGDVVVTGSLISNGAFDYRVSYSNAPAGINGNLATGVVLDGFGGTDTISNISQIRGSNFDDTLTGGNTTPDFQDFESFDPRGGNDLIVGGSGFDRIEYRSPPTGILLDLTVGTVLDGFGGTDTFSGIEGIRATSFDDSLFGGVDDNFERFSPRAGNDLVDGRTGFDELDYRFEDATQGVLVNLARGVATDGAGGTDTILNIEAVRGTIFDDTLIGGGDNNFERFRGKEGNDIIDGGTGFDQVSYQGETGPVTVNLATGIALDGSGGTDTLSNIEFIRGSDGDDLLIGGGAGIGVSNFEAFRGEAGNDTIQGGDGFDRAEYNSATGPITIDVALGRVSGDASVGTDTLDSVEWIRGSDFADTYRGGLPPNANTSFSGLADDVFEGRGGNDIVNGDGNTTAAYFSATGGVVVDLAAGTARGDASVGTDALSGVANVVGSEFADRIRGNAGDNFIQGRDGIDTLDGGAGVDTAFYFSNSSTSGLIINLATSTVTNDGLGNADIIANFENVEGTFFGDQIAGSAVANRLDGHAGDDTIGGGGGNDTLIGGGGADLLDGGLGNDTFQYDQVGDGTRIATNQTIAASGVATDVINGFTSGSDEIDINETEFVVLAGAQFATIGTPYDGTNSGLTSGTAFIFDGTHLSYDPDVNAAGHTAMAQVNGDPVGLGDLTPV